MVWDECAAVGMPRAIVVTHLEAARADYAQMTTVCGENFAAEDPDAVIPLYLPLYGPPGPDGHAPVAGLLGLLSRRVYDYTSGERVERDPEPAELSLISDARSRLIEGIIAESEDESLMDRYLGGEDIDFKTLVDDLERAVARGTFYPVLMAAPAADGARQGLGTVELLELITGGFPTPLERAAVSVTAPDGADRPAVTCDPDGPLVAEVVKTSSDPYVGRVSLVRVFSGTLRPEETVHVSGHGLTDRGHEDHDVDERIGTLTSPSASSSAHSPRSSPGTSPAWPNSPGPRPATPSRPRTGPCSWSPGRCPTRCSPSPSPPTARPTRTSSRRGWPGSSPRTPRCGWSRTRTPTRSSCGASARPTRTWPSNGCAPATGSRSTQSRTR